jgi:hypothetical protein
LKEFLLVPYFGACIHSPPPPANQIMIIYVTSEDPVKGFYFMELVWVYGILDMGHNDTDMGRAGYTMKSVKVEHYSE